MTELDREIDVLFHLSLSEFTPARNALAARLKKEKRPIDAGRVKSLPKPSAPAWAVNQLYWEDPKAIDRLIAVSASVRKAQTRELLDEMRRMTAELVERAATILRAAGHAAPPDAMRRVSATLESLAVWGNTKGAPATGRLTADLDPPGFDALVAVMGDTKIDSATVLAFRTPKPAEDRAAAARARAREAVQAAENVLREARREAAAAEAALTKANARYAEAKGEVRTASIEAKKAAEAVARAERALAEAKR